MGSFLTSEAAGDYLFIFIQKKFPPGWAVQPCSLAFLLVDLEVISVADNFFKGSSEQGCSRDGFLFLPAHCCGQHQSLPQLTIPWSMTPKPSSRFMALNL